jgi:hypothetical protein
VYYVKANSVTFDPPNHDSNKFSQATCVKLNVVNPLGASGMKIDIYYKTGSPSQRFDLLGTSPGTFNADKSIPKDGTCVEKAATSVPADKAACEAVTALADSTACGAVKTKASATAAACTYIPARAAFSTDVDPGLTKYTGCIKLTESTAIAAVAIGDGFAPSVVTVATYWIEIDEPVISVAGSGGITALADSLTPTASTDMFYSYMTLAFPPR